MESDAGRSRSKPVLRCVDAHHDNVPHYGDVSDGGRKGLDGAETGRLVVTASVAFDGFGFLAGGATVLIEDTTIIDVLPAGSSPPAGWPTLCTTTVLPGLIDTHVHLVGAAEPNALLLDADRTAAERAAVIDRSLAQQLAAGVTTLRDLGDTDWAVRDRCARPNEPTILSSGPPITTPGGHCASMGGAASGADGLRAAVAQRAERGADIVKIMVSGGAMTAGSNLLALQYTEQEVRSVVAEAHGRGLGVTAHAHSLESVYLCLRAGVDAIEHCSCLTPTGVSDPADLGDELARSGVLVTPTFGRLPDQAPSPQAAALSRATGFSLSDRFDQVGGFHRSGVRLSAGSDAGIHPAKPHGVLPYSVLELIGCGLPVAEAVSTATGAAAAGVGLAGRHGVLRRGARADLLLLAGDLTADPTALLRPERVILAGRAVGSAVSGASPIPS